ncbi:aminopeptidase P family protein [Vibrio mangrovi]|uniref:Aminopeptidase P family protein n=1 Tax=Vibrio mangrovi TaxID=474394 RepID=A0A1Y6IWJ8_9VIBR|nr:aminopeptidase P family protein [Vibrio mangrovi]MDW6002455.1 aminopeptidase P family protein [Vibrio mangrovi]SMS02016.1 Xaa-Pro dipeptidase [Vibrio mangrovi]
MQNHIPERISNIRSWLKENQLDALIVPHEDEYLGEYLPAHNERLQWITGFTGSAGVAVITQEHASIFVDGRYTVQVTKQVPDSIFEYHHLIEEPFLDWIIDHLSPNSKVGFDPRLHRSIWVTHTQQTLSGKLTLCPLQDNPIDLLWQDRPVPFYSKMWFMDTKLSGQSSEDKRQAIAEVLRKKQAHCALLTQTDSICWLLNIRGQDISCLPVLLSYAIIYEDATVDFFIDPQRVINGFEQHVGPGVNICPPVTLEASLANLKGKQVLFDPATCNAWFSLTLQNAGVSTLHVVDPCMLPKAAKNASEVSGMQACHIRDGAAMAKFLSWLDQEVAQGNMHNEAALSDQLARFRQEDPTLLDFSFDTISAAGSNAAMCHYNHLNQITPGQLTPDSFYLVDSGGQYTDGTTDITRTVAIGTPSSLMKQQFTLVLKGHIALASARFPQGTSGHQLDALARQHLWAHGYDFDHGTGHGVGHCLNVHEGPQRISKAPNTVALLPGMVVSNEPGYYRAEQFGIRIENLELVVPVDTEGDFDVLGFESLTRCPIDLRAIDFSLLTDAEIQWLNTYHQKVWNDVSPLVSGMVREWLQQATQPVSQS